MSRSRCGPRVDEHFDVGERHVDEDNLREGRRDRLYRDPVILLLVNQFDAVADAGAGVLDKVRAVVQQHRAVADEVTGRPKRAADKQTGRAM
jgi:hypothetical protein